MSFTKNNRSISERPRSARLRRRPSIPQEEVQKAITKPTECEQSGLTVKKNTKSKHALNLLDTSNLLGFKKKVLGSDRERTSHKLTVPNSMELLSEKKNANVLNCYQRNGSNPSKSPRILPKLNESGPRKVVQSEIPEFSILLDEKKGIDVGGVPLGKQYSILPNISHTSEGGYSHDVSL